MSIITGIDETRGVYHISLDGREELRLDKKTFTKLGLRQGQDIDLDETLEKASYLQFDSAYECALNMLDRSSKTAAQIKSALVRRGFTDEVADKCVIRLINARLINDTEYAVRLVQTNSSKPVSKFSLRQKLRAKGLSSADIDAALENVTQESQTLALKRLAEKLSGRYEGLDPREGRQKLSLALARRGFGWDDVKAAVDEIYSNNDDY